MEYARLGGSNIRVSKLALGTMNFGVRTDEAEAFRIMDRALELGISFFDTANVCGITSGRPDGQGMTEELIGRWFAQGGDQRERTILATKVAGPMNERIYGPNDARGYSGFKLRRQLDESLARLQTDYVDLYYLLRPDPKVPVEVVAETMAELIAEGKILRWGVSEHSVDDIRRAHKIYPLTVVQSRCAMIYREHESDGVLDACEEMGIGYVVYSPLGNGFLSAAYDKDSTFEQGVDYRRLIAAYKPEEQDRARPLSNLVRAIAEAYGATSAQVALAWTMRKPFVVPIPGTRKLQRLQENAGSVDLVLTQNELQALEECLDQLGC